jgi:hypothetical protein
MGQYRKWFNERPTPNAASRKRPVARRARRNLVADFIQNVDVTPSDEMWRETSRKTWGETWRETWCADVILERADARRQT